jgi:multidrug efflux pump subunit AcrB
MVVHLVSPDESLDTLFSSNYALLQIRDELARLPGVGDVNVFGAREYSMRIWLDPEKIAARGLTAQDVTQSIAEQNVQVAAGIVGAPPCRPTPPPSNTRSSRKAGSPTKRPSGIS